MPGMESGPDLIAGMGVVGSLDVAGKGVLTEGGGSGIVRTGRSGSVLTRRRRLCVSAGLDDGVGDDGAGERPAVPACAVSGEGLVNCCLAGSCAERISGLTMRSG